MPNKISILHISDLHKREQDDFDNLYQSLVTDCQTYTAQGIMKPNVIVVSGDLIRGGRPEEIATQYKESRNFLEKMTGYFLNGDKRRIVIVPGNHDVDWNVSKSVMQSFPRPALQINDEMTPEQKNEAEGKFKKETDEYGRTMKLYRSGELPYHRWNWDMQELQFVRDVDAYNKRFEQFATFYKDFYGEDYPMNPKEQFKLFDLPYDGFCFVGFNSCFQNDHINHSGQIAPQCVTRATSEMQKLKDRVFIGVWHHNIQGLPIVDNYLDYRALDALVNMDMRIALHGHQHYSSVVKKYKNVDDENSYMLVLSTGSLYGTAKILNYGSARQYNIVEIERDTTELKLTMHQREDDNETDYDIPEWVDGEIKGVNKAHWHKTIAIPSLQNEDEQISQIISDAINSGDYMTAIQKLKQFDAGKPEIRGLIINFYTSLKDHRGLIEFIGNPQNYNESIKILNAAVTLNDRDLNNYIRNLEPIKNSTDDTIRQLLINLR